MKKEQVNLARESLVVVRPIADQVANSFYARLFEIAPHLRKLFMGDMERQGMMLMTSLELAISSLDDLESILPAIRALGERHVSYGVKPEYYPFAKESFLWALEKNLGEGFSPALKEAWASAFDILIGMMARTAEDGSVG